MEGHCLSHKTIDQREPWSAKGVLKKEDRAVSVPLGNTCHGRAGDLKEVLFLLCFTKEVQRGTGAEEKMHRSLKEAERRKPGMGE